MSIKGSIAGDGRYHLYNHALLSDEPTSVFLELISPASFELLKDGRVETLTCELPHEIMDEIAIAWIKHRRLTT